MREAVVGTVTCLGILRTSAAWLAAFDRAFGKGAVPHGLGVGLLCRELADRRRDIGRSRSSHAFYLTANIAVRSTGKIKASAESRILLTYAPDKTLASHWPRNSLRLVFSIYGDSEGVTRPLRRRRARGQRPREQEGPRRVQHRYQASTMRSGYRESAMALPSRRNSGLLATPKRMLFGLPACASRIPSRTSVSTRLPLPTGTVDLFTTTRNRASSMAAPMPRAAASR